MSSGTSLFLSASEEQKKGEKVKPELSRVKEIAMDSGFRRVPVYEEMYADELTPIMAMKKLRAASKHVYLLESASQDKTWGRYSFLGYKPELEITCQKGHLTEKTLDGDKTVNTIEKDVKHPGEELRRIVAKYKSAVLKELPYFTGGLVGYFSYDYIRYAEPKLTLSDDGDFKDMDLMLFNDVIAFDHYEQKIYLISGVDTADPENSYKRAEKRIAEIRSQLSGDDSYAFKPIELQTEIEPMFSKEEYAGMVEKAKHFIHEGDIFQVVLSNPLTAKVKGDLFDTYRVLRTTNPSPYMFYFSSEDIELTGASPETLARLQNGKISSFPLAGTRPRGRSDEEDEKLIKDLLSDEKELSEHNMLVDLGRNDVGKVSKLGTVKVTDYLKVQKYSQVMHIGSTVEGEIRNDMDAIDAVDAILPAGTLSGAPKFRACQIIEELEHNQRGIYGGAIGYIDFSGNLDVCIAIRLAYKKKDLLTIRSGAGIVADSVPEKEFQECQNKAKAVVLAVKKAEGGI